MRGEIHGHVPQKVEKVKTAAVTRMRQKLELELRLSRCLGDGKSDASDATCFAIPSPFS